MAYPSLIARVFSAVAITWLCFDKKKAVSYRMDQLLARDGKLLKSILGVAIPNGTENGIFQLVKVALSSIVALFGTYQIAANGVAQSIWSLAALAGVAIGPVFITVIGQCMGVMLNLGVIGIALAMAADWTIRAVIFWLRLRSGAWKKFKVI